MCLDGNMIFLWLPHEAPDTQADKMQQAWHLEHGHILDRASPTFLSTIMALSSPRSYDQASSTIKTVPLSSFRTYSHPLHIVMILNSTMSITPTMPQPISTQYSFQHLPNIPTLNETSSSTQQFLRYPPSTQTSSLVMLLL